MQRAASAPGFSAPVFLAKPRECSCAVRHAQSTPDTLPYSWVTPHGEFEEKVTPPFQKQQSPGSPVGSSNCRSTVREGTEGCLFCTLISGNYIEMTHCWPLLQKENGFPNISVLLRTDSLISRLVSTGFLKNI